MLAEEVCTTGAGPGAWLRRSAWVVIAMSLFGAAFPYWSAAVGLPLDGAPDGAMTLWRTVLHLVPGVAGTAAGIGLLLGGAPRAGSPRRELVAAGRLGMATGAWFAVGPYLWALVQPAHAVGTGGLAGAMTGMRMSWVSQILMPVSQGLERVAPHMTTASCALTMGVCHWAVGALVALGSAVGLGTGAGVGPLAALRPHRPPPLPA